MERKMSHRLLGEIVEKDGRICLQNVRGNAWFPLEGNSGIAADFQASFNTPHPSDIGRRLYYVGGVMQMESLEQAAERRAKEKQS
jgi:hypothetical protein